MAGDPGGGLPEDRVADSRVLPELCTYPQHLAGLGWRPRWLRVDRLLAEWGIPKDSGAGPQVFAKRMEWRRGEDLRQEFKRVERGGVCAGRSFGKSYWSRWRGGRGRAMLGKRCGRPKQQGAERGANPCTGQRLLQIRRSH